MLILVTFIEFAVGDEFGRLIFENYNIINLYIIKLFISTIRVGDSGLKHWCIMEYIELDRRKKIYFIKLSLYDDNLNLPFAIDF